MGMSETLQLPKAAGHPRPRLVGRHLALVFAAAFSMLTGFFLLFSVVPMYAAAGGAGGVGAGAATGALMLTTVLAELSLPGCSRGSGTGGCSRWASCSSVSPRWRCPCRPRW